MTEKSKLTRRELYDRIWILWLDAKETCGEDSATANLLLQAAHEVAKQPTQNDDARDNS